MIDAAELDAIIEQVTTHAFDAGRDCPHCEGSGKIRDGSWKDLIVHCRGRITGADWDVDGVIATLRSARNIEWVAGGGHDLQVTEPDGRVWRFQIPRPGTPKEVQ